MRRRRLEGARRDASLSLISQGSVLYSSSLPIIFFQSMIIERAAHSETMTRRGSLPPPQIADDQGKVSFEQKIADAPPLPT